ncbi:hypothetical protein [uncultured Sunxiuqinia sp.]|uniref:hypothetical protein n=1 Tax=uncultured Sunxiuqinia sp. TaxID=1573825 RepID=UPI0030DB5998|tara:strand:- start:1676 stop:2149 length:474 start_codon:yes stop_codon:yes gene_type:complete
MKRNNRIIGFLLVALFVCSLSVFAGGETTFVDDYKISSKENFEPTKAFQQSWEITYGESKRPVQVLLKETKKGEEYIIRTNYFEVKYVNSEKGFGARPMNVADMIVPENLNAQVINDQELGRQEVISLSKVDRQKALDLIAGFLPELVNSQYKNILN